MLQSQTGLLTFDQEIKFQSSKFMHNSGILSLNLFFGLERLFVANSQGILVEVLLKDFLI